MQRMERAGRCKQSKICSFSQSTQPPCNPLDWFNGYMAGLVHEAGCAPMDETSGRKEGELAWAPFQRIQDSEEKHKTRAKPELSKIFQARTSQTPVNDGAGMSNLSFAHLGASCCA
jgi:hypothetical protein